MQNRSVITRVVILLSYLTISPCVLPAQMPVFVNNVAQESTGPASSSPQTKRLLAVTAEATAVVANGLTLETLQALAETNNPSLCEAVAYVQAAQGRWLQAGLPPNPTFGYSGQQIASHGLAEQQGVMVGQQIVTGGKLRLNREVMAQEIQVARRNYESQRLRVRTDVTMHFVDAFAAQQRAEVTHQLSNISRESFATVERLLKANEGTRIDLLQAKLEAENAHILSQQARYRVDTTWRVLSNVVGLQGTAVEPLDGSLDSFLSPGEFDAIFAHLEQNSPEIAAARAQIERARWDYQLAKRERIGNIDAQGIVQKDEATNQHNGALQIFMPLPVWDRKQGRISEAYANIAAAERAEQKLRLNLRQNLAGVYETYLNANHQIEHYTKEILPSAEEHLKLVTSAKRAGELNYSVVLLAQRTLAQARLAYLDAQRERARAASQIQGLLLQDSLQANFGP